MSGSQAQRLADLEQENAALKAAGTARGRVLKQSRAVIDAYLQRSAALGSSGNSKQDVPAPPIKDAREVVEAVDSLSGAGSTIAPRGADDSFVGARENGKVGNSAAGLVPALDGITTG